MHLNEYEKFAEFDPENMLEYIDNLPDQLWSAWKLGLELPLPDFSGITSVLVAGMGGSAIGADLLSSYVADRGKVPILVLREYDLPAWVDEHTLLICSSNSGNTEEVLSVLEQAKELPNPKILIGRGGKLQTMAEKYDLPFWGFDYESQPRAAVGYSFGMLLAIYYRLGFLDDPTTELEEAVAQMKRQQERIGAEVPDTSNIAKRFAGQFMERVGVIYAPGFLAPVGRRWKGQLNENANSQAYLEMIPEACHNTYQGVEQPSKALTCEFHFFLTSEDVHPRNKLRVEEMKMGLLMEGMGTDAAIGKGKSRLAQMWTLIHFGDYVSYYLAMLYEIDPTPVNKLAEMKASLAEVD